MQRFCSNRINRFSYYSGINALNDFNLFHSIEFNCYLYIGYNFNIKNNKNLLKYNSKSLNVYQNSHWDENFNFIDLILPNILFFEKRTYLYINCLGLIKRIPALFSNFNKNLLNDIDILSFFFQICPQFYNTPNITNIKKG
jgi:hypothetical protein